MYQEYGASLVAKRLKHLPPMRETRVRSLGQEDPLEKKMVAHSSILAWRIPWMEKPGRLQSTGSQRVGHDWVTSPSLIQSARSGFPSGSDGKESACSAGDPGSIPGSGSSPGEGNSNLLQYSHLENPMEREVWRATVHGFTKSQTRLKWFSMQARKYLVFLPLVIATIQNCSGYSCHVK